MAQSTAQEAYIYGMIHRPENRLSRCSNCASEHSCDFFTSTVPLSEDGFRDHTKPYYSPTRSSIRNERQLWEKRQSWAHTFPQRPRVAITAYVRFIFDQTFGIQGRKAAYRNMLSKRKTAIFYVYWCWRILTPHCSRCSWQTHQFIQVLLNCLRREGILQLPVTDNGSRFRKAESKCRRSPTGCQDFRTVPRHSLSNDAIANTVKIGKSSLAFANLGTL